MSVENTNIFVAIAEMAVRWSELEFTINDAIWELMNVERGAGACLTSQLIGPGPRIRCLVSLLKLRKAPQASIDAINSLTGDIESLGRQRNRYLHDPIMMRNDTGKLERLEATADRTLKYGFVPISAAEIAKVSDKILAAIDNFDRLYLETVAVTPPWPRTQFEQSAGIARPRSGPDKSAEVRPHPPEPFQG
jgi:hypothetical protein